MLAGLLVFALVAPLPVVAHAQEYEYVCVGVVAVLAAVKVTDWPKQIAAELVTAEIASGCDTVTVTAVLELSQVFVPTTAT